MEPNLVIYYKIIGDFRSDGELSAWAWGKDSSFSEGETGPTGAAGHSRPHRHAGSAEFASEETLTQRLLWSSSADLSYLTIWMLSFMNFLRPILIFIFLNIAFSRIRLRDWALSSFLAARRPAKLQKVKFCCAAETPQTSSVCFAYFCLIFRVQGRNYKRKFSVWSLGFNTPKWRWYLGE